MDEKILSIIIPAHNEEKRIGETLEGYCKFFQDKKKGKDIQNFEILVVLNACSDNTLDVVKQFQKKFKEIKFLDFAQGGKGFAIIEGFKDALKRENNLIGFVDADMATPPESFYDLVKNLNEYSGIIGSRWLKKSIIRTEQTPLRKITSRGFNFIVRILFLMPYKDTQCGAKLFKNKALKKITPELGITRWAFDIDLLYRLRKNKFKIKEIPTTWEDKEGSKINLLKAPFQMFAAVVRLRLIHSPFEQILRPVKFLLRFGDKIINK